MNNWIENIPNMPELAKGAHKESENKLCAMEMVAFMERLPHSDSPPCTCPVLAQYVRSLNDHMPDERRQDLKPILPLLVGTTNPDLEVKRAELFAMAAVTKIVPIALEGKIDKSLIDAMKQANTLKEAHAAADAAYAAYAYADAAAYAAAAYAAHAAADAANAADAAAYAAAAADAAAAAAAYAAAAADAAAAAAAYAAADAAAADAADIWSIAIEVLVEAIHLDPSIKPVQWQPERVEELVELVK